MKLGVSLLLGVVLLSPAAVRGEPAGQRAGRTVQSGPAPASLAMQVAREVFSREHWKKLVGDAASALTQKLVLSADGQYELAPEFGDRLRDEYERMVPYEELLVYQAKILGREYSRAELRALLRFYRSPLGRKSISLLHDLSAVSDYQVKAKVHDGMEAALRKLLPLVKPGGGGAPEPDATGEGAPEADAGPSVGPGATDGGVEVPDFSQAESEAKVL